MNIQNEVQKIHAKYGVTEMANYEIQKVCENYARIQIEKDRERVISGIVGDELGSDIINFISNKPIILD